MEFRNFNLLRQEKYRYDFIPSEIVALADYRAKKNRELSRITSKISKIAAVGSLLAGLYFTAHVLWWVLR
jgi:hypothetical protein